MLWLISCPSNADESICRCSTEGESPVLLHRPLLMRMVVEESGRSPLKTDHSLVNTKRWMMWTRKSKISRTFLLIYVIGLKEKREVAFLIRLC